jgi:hypothetical protein
MNCGGNGCYAGCNMMSFLPSGEGTYIMGGNRPFDKFNRYDEDVLRYNITNEFW